MVIENLKLSDILLCGAGTSLAVLVSICQDIAVMYYREKHPKSQKSAIFVDPRSDFEQFMEGFDYNKNKTKMYNNEFNDWFKCCPYPNPNPNNLFGRFAQRNGYFKISPRILKE